MVGLIWFTPGRILRYPEIMFHEIHDNVTNSYMSRYHKIILLVLYTLYNQLFNQLLILVDPMNPILQQDAEPEYQTVSDDLTGLRLMLFATFCAEPRLKKWTGNC
jgi:hypothetical protein